MRGQEAGGKKKDGERKKTKPYTIPSRGFAPGKLPLDRPHQGAVCYCTERTLPQWFDLVSTVQKILLFTNAVSETTS